MPFSACGLFLSVRGSFWDGVGVGLMLRSSPAMGVVGGPVHSLPWTFYAPFGAEAPSLSSGTRLPSLLPVTSLLCALFSLSASAVCEMLSSPNRSSEF